MPSAERTAVGALLAALPPRAWRRVTWRRGTKGPLAARFAAVHVVGADGAPDGRAHQLRGEAA